MSIHEVRQLPRQEKLRLMETLWIELSRDETELESPAWHALALAETTERLAAGQEQTLDWQKAKAALSKPPG